MKIQKPNSKPTAVVSVSDPSGNAAVVGQTGPAKAKLKTHANIIREREMTNLIGEVEFGDWLIGERTVEPVISLHEKASTTKTTLSRSESLKIAEAMLFEFLTFQQAMLKNAEQARGSR
jgi:hypothetical protein